MRLIGLRNEVEFMELEIIRNERKRVKADDSSVK